MRLLPNWRFTEIRDGLEGQKRIQRYRTVTTAQYRVEFSVWYAHIQDDFFITAHFSGRILYTLDRINYTHLYHRSSGTYVKLDITEVPVSTFVSKFFKAFREWSTEQERWRA